MTRPIIITDLDNTVLDFPPHFEDWVESKGHRIKRGILGTQTYFIKDIFEDSEVDSDCLVMEFYNCDHTMQSFPVLRDAVKPIQRLHASGWDFVAITACAPLKGLAEHRKANLRNLFGFEFLDVFVTGYNESKRPVLETYQPTYWVEDSLEHAKDGAEIGHTVFLIDHPYNKGDGPFTRVHDWNDIEKHIGEANVLR